MPSPLPRRTRAILGCSCASPGTWIDGRGGGLPFDTARSASASGGFGTCSAFTFALSGIITACRFAEPPLRPFDIRSFNRFVASSTVPTATGRNNQLPGRDFHPLTNDTFSRRTMSAPPAAGTSVYELPENRPRRPSATPSVRLSVGLASDARLPGRNALRRASAPHPLTPLIPTFFTCQESPPLLSFTCLVLVGPDTTANRVVPERMGES